MSEVKLMKKFIDNVWVCPECKFIYLCDTECENEECKRNGELCIKCDIVGELKKNES